LSTLQAVSPLGQSAFFASLSASSLSRSILRIRPLPLADGPKTETTPGPPQNCAVLPGHGWLHWAASTCLPAVNKFQQSGRKTRHLRTPSPKRGSTEALTYDKHCCCQCTLRQIR
jgi:hypothetical protein